LGGGVWGGGGGGGGGVGLSLTLWTKIRSIPRWISKKKTARHKKKKKRLFVPDPSPFGKQKIGEKVCFDSEGGRLTRLGTIRKQDPRKKGGIGSKLWLVQVPLKRRGLQRKMAVWTINKKN